MQKIPFEKTPKIGWWRDSKILTLYHGTHERNIESIDKNSLNKVDPKTGMISITLDPFTAHGYAAMSGSGGEANFRSSSRVVNTPHEERAIIVLKIPLDWLLKNYDEKLAGNFDYTKNKLINKSEYDDWFKKYRNSRDIEYYAVSEFRVKYIPRQYIKAYSKKIDSPIKRVIK